MKENFYVNKLSDAERELYNESVDLLDKGQKKEAEKKLISFLEKKENFIPALNKMAVIRIHKKEYAKAEELLTQILEVDPKYAPAVTNLGSIAKAKKDLEKAKELYQKAVKIDEEYGPAYNNLGVIYREEGNYSKSVKYLKKARKNGSFSYSFNSDRAFYKEPSCLLLIFVAAIIIFVLYLILI